VSVAELRRESATSGPAWLAGRRWLRRTDPFPHVVAYDVFAPPVLARLEDAFRTTVEEHGGRPYLAAYDIGGASVTAETAHRFEPLVTRAFHDMIANLLGLSVTGHVACGLHQHRIGSSSGFAHNDLNPGWFNGVPGPGELVLGDDAVSYTTGETYDPTVRPVETVRAAALLFYLANEPWTPGDGGFTGLYESGDTPVDRPRAIAPPINNSLLLFRCTPRSYHTFVSNQRHVRNSIIMWLHRPAADVVREWGPDAIVPYGEP
jgi:hypothetical protein